MNPAPPPAESVGTLMRALYRRMSPAQRSRLRATTGLMLLAALAELGTIGMAVPFLALLIDPARAAAFPGYELVAALAGNPASLLPLASALLIAAALLAGLTRLLVLRSTHRFAFGLGHEIGTEIFGRTLRQPYVEHVGRNPAEVFAGVEKVHVLIYAVLMPVMQGLVAAILAAAIVAVLAVVAPLVTAAAVATTLLLYAAISRITGPRLRANSAVIAQASSARMKALREGLGALRDILLGHAQSLFEAKFATLDRAYRRAQAENLFIGSAPRMLFETAGIVLVCGAALYASGRPGGLTAALPILGAIALGAQRLLPLVNSAYLGWTMLAGNVEILRDILALLARPAAESASASAEPPPFEREIRFDQVSLSYPGRGPAVHDVDLTLPKGSRVGITGPSGSGKSSLLDLLMGLLEPDRGEIRIDGRRLDDSTRGGWQRQIAHVPQTVYLADASIAANIAFGEAEAGIDLDRVRSAARRAQLDDFIAGLPEGYETLVGDAGVRLSGGQRQRVALARAFYKEAQLLILDEATGQLDPDTERAILADVAALDRTVTIVIVGHQPAALASCDWIVRLDQGRIAAVETAQAPRRRA